VEAGRSAYGGARFSVRLPLEAIPAEAPEVAQEPTHPATFKERS
jgi:hypothetical protein